MRAVPRGASRRASTFGVLRDHANGLHTSLRPSEQRRGLVRNSLFSGTSFPIWPRRCGKGDRCLGLVLDAGRAFRRVYARTRTARYETPNGRRLCGDLQLGVSRKDGRAPGEWTARSMEVRDGRGEDLEGTGVNAAQLRSLRIRHARRLSIVTRDRDGGRETLGT